MSDLDSLKQKMKELDVEYVRLSAELEKKKQARKERPDIAPALGEFKRKLEDAGEAARKQSEEVQALDAFHKKNEALLDEAARRLDSLHGSGPEVKAELLNMLEEIQSMRKKRESLEQKLSPEVTKNV
jgi:chromosome segregation ATPase